MDLCGARGLLDLLVRRVRASANRRFSRTGRGRGTSPGRPPRPPSARDGNVRSRTADAVDRDGAERGIAEPRDEVGAGRLAEPVSPTSAPSSCRAGRRTMSSSVQASCSYSNQTVEGDVPSRPPEAFVRRCRPAGRGTGRSVEERERALHLELHAEEFPIGKKSRGLERREGDQRADRDRVAPARDRPAPRRGRRAQASRRTSSGSRPSSTCPSCGSAPRARRAAATPSRTGRPGRLPGPSSSRGESPRRRATPGRSTRRRRARPAARPSPSCAGRRRASSARRRSGAARARTRRAASRAGASRRPSRAPSSRSRGRRWPSS